MPFVSCEKQISSFATAIGTASAADKQTIINALSVNKDVAYVESNAFKIIAGEYRPSSSVLPKGNPVTFGSDTAVDASFGTWNAATGTFTFTKTGHYYINYDATILAQVTKTSSAKSILNSSGAYVDRTYTDNTGLGGECGSYFKIGGKEYFASGTNLDFRAGANLYQGAPAKGSITVKASAGQTLQLWAYNVKNDSVGDNLVGIGAPSGWLWGIQITQV